MKILCVDDEPLMLKMLEMAVSEAKPDAEIEGFEEYPRTCLRQPKRTAATLLFLIYI